MEEAEVYRQFGPEAMAVLDRVFYLGGLPRPNVGIARERLDRINAILGATMEEATEEALREALHGYKKGTIDGDELAHELACVLSTDDARVVRIMDEVFPEFRELAPESSRATLRSHMTSGWFQTLGAIWDRSPLPLRLFSVDRCFRREQEEGPTRLMTYHSASCVVAGEDVTNEAGKAVAAALLSAFGFTDFRFQPDEKRSKYYMPDSQTEVYARHPAIGWVEVATFGLYSPSALAEYGVGVPVMNLGLGVERLAMVLNQADDVRAMVFPQFHPRAAQRHRARGRGRPARGAGHGRGAVHGRARSRPSRPSTATRRARSRSRPGRATVAGTPPHGLRRGARGDLQAPRAGLHERGLRPRRLGPRRARHREVPGRPRERRADRASGSSTRSRPSAPPGSRRPRGAARARRSRSRWPSSRATST